MFDPAERAALFTVIEGLRVEVLERTSFRLAGGGRLALELQEYRRSRDIAFLCDQGPGYGLLRQIALNEGYPTLFREDALPRLHFPRELRADQYGIRFAVEVDKVPLRVEFVREARLLFGPACPVSWCSLPCLAIVDCYAEKLLANSDRWADRASLSRDFVDLATMRAQIGPIPEAAWRSAEQAYLGAPRADLPRAIGLFLRDTSHRDRCFGGLSVDEPAMVLAGVQQLATEYGGTPEED